MKTHVTNESSQVLRTLISRREFFKSQEQEKLNLQLTFVHVFIESNYLSL